MIIASYGNGPLHGHAEKDSDQGGNCTHDLWT